MNLTPSQWAALLPLILPALGACLIPLMALDKDQTTLKWIRVVRYGTALLAVGARPSSRASSCWWPRP